MKIINKKDHRNRYSAISKLGSKLNLVFSSLMSLGNKTIALDGIRKKLMVVNNNEDLNLNCVIDLDQVKNISINKNYGSIKAGALREKKFDEFLESILLRFDYKDQDKSFSLPFYELGRNNLFDLPMLERNARNWQMILSKMIAPKSRDVAT